MPYQEEPYQDTKISDNARGHGAMGGGISAVRTGAVTSEYGVLARELDLLGEVFDQLRVKLEPVIGQSCPHPSDANKAEAEPALSPFAESIRSDARKVRNFTAAVSELISRVEL